MGKSGLSLARVITATAMVAGLIASLSGQSAGAEDLDTVKARAQSVADEVTELERRAQGMEERKAELDGRIVDLSGEIGALESKVGDIGRELADAQDIYIERAIEAYKSGAAGTELDALLAAETMSEFISIAEINSVATSVDLQRLQELERSRAEIEEAQTELDGRKQEQIEARAEIEVLGAELRTTLDDRRASLRQLAADVRELEQQVRRDAQITQPSRNPTSVVRHRHQGHPRRLRLDGSQLRRSRVLVRARVRGQPDCERRDLRPDGPDGSQQGAAVQHPSLREVPGPRSSRANQRPRALRW